MASQKKSTPPPKAGGSAPAPTRTKPGSGQNVPAGSTTQRPPQPKR